MLDFDINLFSVASASDVGVLKKVVNLSSRVLFDLYEITFISLA